MAQSCIVEEKEVARDMASVGTTRVAAFAGFSLQKMIIVKRVDVNLVYQDAHTRISC